MQRNYSETFIRQLLQNLKTRRYDVGHPVKVVLSLDNGVVLRGEIVSPDEFQSSNRPRRGEGLRRGHGGSLPKDFDYAEAYRESDEFVHLVNVEYLSGGRWVKGSTAQVPAGAVITSGDRY